MQPGEFELIERYFTTPTPRAAVGPGDDCAVLAPAAGMQWAISTDMLVEGRHFLPTVPPRALGHKALAVNLSDLAACGARPVAFTLALSMPRAEPAWLEAFAGGLLALAREHGCELVGGDTTAGPVVTLSITVFGEVPAASPGAPGGPIPPTGALLRSGARPGDDIWVSGALGDARLALEAWRGQIELERPAMAQARRAMEWPQPRVALGLALRGLASCAIDLSDGLIGDLRHVLGRSGVGARVEADAVPAGPALAAQPLPLRRLCTLAGGDDYELLFTAAPARREAIEALVQQLALPLTRIGRIEAEPGLRLVDAQGQAIEPPGPSFDHFRAAEG